MLRFIGTGSAFNTKLGNTSAFVKDNNRLLIIDCGSTTFSRMMEFDKLFEGVTEIDVIITHTHADHVGSLADLVLYSYYSLGEIAKNKINIYTHQECRVDRLLMINGCVPLKHYNLFNKLEDEEFKVNGFCLCKFIPSEHVSELSSFSLELRLYGKRIYYSGDLNKIQNEVLENIDLYDKMYIDTCGADYPGNVHLSFNKLKEAIPTQYRDKVYCMHLDEKFDAVEAIAEGFNVTIPLESFMKISDEPCIHIAEFDLDYHNSRK